MNLTLINMSSILNCLSCFLHPPTCCLLSPSGDVMETPADWRQCGKKLFFSFFLFSFGKLYFLCDPGFMCCQRKQKFKLDWNWKCLVLNQLSLLRFCSSKYEIKFIQVMPQEQIFMGESFGSDCPYVLSVSCNVFSLQHVFSAASSSHHAKKTKRRTSFVKSLISKTNNSNKIKVQGYYKYLFYFSLLRGW